jgi:hypothetical protein
MNRIAAQPRFTVNGVGTGEVTQWEVFDRNTASRVAKPAADVVDAQTVAVLLNSLPPYTLAWVLDKIAQEVQP